MMEREEVLSEEVKVEFDELLIDYFDEAKQEAARKGSWLRERKRKSRNGDKRDDETNINRSPKGEKPSIDSTTGQ